MYALTPLKVYALDQVRDDSACMTRMERILSALGKTTGDLVWITDESLPDVVEELQNLWPPERVPEGQVRSFMRPIVFTRMDLSSTWPDLTPLLARCPAGTSLGILKKIYGQMTTAIDQHPHHLDQRNNCVCWPTINFGTISGCPHGCQYCGAGRGGKFLTVALNLEEFMEKVVGPVIEENPWNKVFRMILDGADLITFEPEYGLHDLFTRKLAEYEGRYGHFHTVSSNVEWMADLPHRDRLVGVWSTTCEAVARHFEPGTGAAIDRIKAARKVQEMGIPVRYKFKPIIPVRNWREEYAQIIQQMLELTEPESIGFCLYIWNTYDTLIQTLDPDLLDPECVDAARKVQDAMKGVRTGPFPHETRAEIYRHFIREVRRWNKDVLLYVSTETREMWDELKDELGQDPRRYICACGSAAVPGKKLALSRAFRYSTYHPTPL
ncbi:MAG TPA: radical SAM protein [Armatimonadota bacterium]|nr:radical SAM protein [Armatimonadota bacterium]HPO73269.1 radical SAM protein [Armatimonadota bacterium]HPT96950.1 radical SAM protein [Armatimonadota bacterium]